MCIASYQRIDPMQAEHLIEIRKSQNIQLIANNSQIMFK